MPHLQPILLTLITFTFTTQVPTEKTITLNPYLAFENYEHFKRLTLSSPDSGVEYLEGFEFEWGYTYRVNVTEEKLDAALSDGTRVEYTFNHVVSKTPVPQGFQFDLVIDPQRYYHELEPEEEYMNATLEVLNDSTYRYFDAVDLVVPGSFQAPFEQMIVHGVSGLGRFEFVEGGGIRLVGLEVR